MVWVVIPAILLWESAAKIIHACDKVVSLCLHRIAHATDA